MKTQTSIFILFIILNIYAKFSNEEEDFKLNFCDKNISKINEINTILKNKESIAQGGFGVVYDLENGTALKRIITEPENNLQELKNELKVFNEFKENINLSHLQDCYYYLNIYGKLNVFMIMDYYKTGSLFLMVRSSISDSLMWKFDIMYKIASELKAMHDKKIAHLDIKLENIFFMNIYNPILGDFGLALHIGEGEKRNFSCGTNPYRAPETFNSFKYSLATDIYALGVLFHEIIEGNIYQTLPDLTIRDNSSMMFKIFQPLITEMRKMDYRPDIDEVINFLLNNFYKVIDLLEQEKDSKEMKYIQFKKYLVYEKNAVKKETVNKTVVKYQNILLNQQEERAKIYKKYEEKVEDSLDSSKENSDTVQESASPIISIPNTEDDKKFVLDNSDSTIKKNSVVSSINNSILNVVNLLFDSSIINSNLIHKDIKKNISKNHFKKELLFGVDKKKKISIKTNELQIQDSSNKNKDIKTKKKSINISNTLLKPLNVQQTQLLEMPSIKIISESELKTIIGSNLMSKKNNKVDFIKRNRELIQDQREGKKIKLEIPKIQI